MILRTAAKHLFRFREKAANRVRPGADDGFDPHEKPFLDHLEDLRSMLIKMLITLGISTTLCFTFHVQIFRFLQWPAKMISLEGGGTLWDRIEFITIGPPEVLLLMLKVSFLTAVVLSLPFLIYFIFEFVLPGLRQVEKRFIIPGAGVGFILFLIGASFSFFVACPIALRFFYVFQNERIGDLNPAESMLRKPVVELPLLGVEGRHIPPVGEAAAPQAAGGTSSAASPPPAPAGETLSPDMKKAVRSYMLDLLAVQEGQNYVLRYDEVRDKIILAYSKGAKATYQIGKYFGFISQMVLMFGLSFQLPVVVTILVKLELLTARVMRSSRRYSWVVIIIAAAVLTPTPDVVTMFLMAGPLIFLYEICVIIASLMEKRRERVMRAEEEERRSRLERLYSKSPSDLTEEEKAELHRREIEQYEKEHAHLYQDDGHHDEHGHRYDEHGHLIDYDPHHPNDHDESWHDGKEEGDELVDEDHKLGPDPQDSDHAEPTPRSLTEEIPNCEPSGPVVDVNHASHEELLELAGGDEWLASMVMDHRPYHSFEELEAIVGQDRVAAWMERLMLG